ncbi:HypC/HybG/HupF family hydrogenase formation chaperone [Candidatus Woesearchaeota archaeon]|nr:HypC/HybG/HupF family hydrogenase formation chaperone [Candidatus Woesearchaeota archaeon]
MAFPGRVVCVEKNKAVVDFLGEKREADCSLVKCNKGDYVVVNAGFVVEIVPEKQAIEAIELFKNANT